MKVVDGFCQSVHAAKSADKSNMKFKPGDTASISKTITDDDIQKFADASGDHNPLHLDDEFAKSTRFGRRIAHGMLSASLISAVIANQLPGQVAFILGRHSSLSRRFFRAIRLLRGSRLSRFVMTSR